MNLERKIQYLFTEKLGQMESLCKESVIQLEMRIFLVIFGLMLVTLSVMMMIRMNFKLCKDMLVYKLYPKARRFLLRC
jgi:hypothetical protein